MVVALSTTVSTKELAVPVPNANFSSTLLVRLLIQKNHGSIESHNICDDVVKQIYILVTGRTFIGLEILT
jgi:hypothetical protein